MTFKDKLVEFKNNMKQEYQETKDIAMHLRDGNYKEAMVQVGDLFKMFILAFVLLLPAGAILSGFLIKMFKNIRPTSFRDKN